MTDPARDAMAVKCPVKRVIMGVAADAEHMQLHAEVRALESELADRVEAHIDAEARAEAAERKLAQHHDGWKPSICDTCDSSDNDFAGRESGPKCGCGLIDDVGVTCDEHTRAEYLTPAAKRRLARKRRPSAENQECGT